MAPKCQTWKGITIIAQSWKHSWNATQPHATLWAWITRISCENCHNKLQHRQWNNMVCDEITTNSYENHHHWKYNSKILMWWITLLAMKKHWKQQMNSCEKAPYAMKQQKTHIKDTLQAMKQQEAHVNYV